MPPEPTEAERLPDKTSDYQEPEKVRISASAKLLEEIANDGPVNPYRFNQGPDFKPLDAVRAFIERDGLPRVSLVDEKYDKLSVRVLEQKVGEVGTNRTQIIQPDGKVITQMNGKTYEYDPKVGPPNGTFTEIGAPPTNTRRPITDAAELNALKTNPASEKTEGNIKTRTFADGRIVTENTTAGPGERKELITYPPGRPDQMRQVEKFNPKPEDPPTAGSTAERRAGRTVTRFEDKTVTEFTPATDKAIDRLTINKVTAFKPPGTTVDGVGPNVAVKTEYNQAPPATGRAGDEAGIVYRFRPENPSGAVEKALIQAKLPDRLAAERTTFADRPGQPPNRVETVFAGATRPGDIKQSTELLDAAGKTTVKQEVKVNGEVVTTFTPPKQMTIKVNGAEQTITVTKLTSVPGAGNENKFKIDNEATPKVLTPKEGTGKLDIGTTERTGKVFADGTRERATTTPDAPVVPARPGDVTVNNDTGLAEKIKIGNREYTVTRDVAPNEGQLKTLSFGTPPGDVVTLTRGGDGKFVVAPADKITAGPPRTLNMDGLRLQVDAGGKIIGDISMNKKGEIAYKSDNGPHRVEAIKKPDGSVVNIDFKTYERTEFAAPGTGATPSKQKAWDGFEWRDYDKKEVGGRIVIEFKPRPGEPNFDPKKPSALERTTNPATGVDQAVVKFQQKNERGEIVDTRTISADWTGRKQVETEAGPPVKTTERYFDGNTYREGTATKAGDVLTVTFKDNKDGEAVSAKISPNGVETTYGKPPQERTLVSDKNGLLTEIRENGKKTRSFERDADGDIRAQVLYKPDGTVRERWERQGKDKAPLMGAAAAREGLEKLGLPGQPNRMRDGTRAAGDTNQFNDWVRTVKDGAPVAVGDRNKPENKKTENAFVTADGAVITEKPTNPVGPKAEVQIEHLGKGGTETRIGNNFTMRGPDGSTIISSDGGKKWRAPGSPEGAGTEGKPFVNREGQLLLRTEIPKPGSTTGEKITKDLRINRDSISELDAAGKEVKRTTRDGTVMTGFDANGNYTKVRPPGATADLTYTWSGTPAKVTEIKAADGKVTHKVERGELRAVEPDGSVKADAPALMVRASDGRILPSDGVVRTDTDTQRLRSVPGKFELKADLQRGPQNYTGELKGSSPGSQPFKLEYNGTVAPTGPNEEIRTLTEVKVPASPGQVEQTFKVGQGTPPNEVANLRVDESRGLIEVTFKPVAPATKGRMVVYNPGDTANYRKEISAEGVAVTSNREGKLTQVAANGGSFALEQGGDGKLTKVTIPLEVGPPRKDAVELTPTNPGDLTLNADGSITQVKGTQVIVHRPGNPRVSETTNYSDAAGARDRTVAKREDTVVECADRKLTFNKDGVLTAATSGEPPRPWGIPPGLTRNDKGEIVVPSDKPLNLKDGPSGADNVIARVAGDSLVIRADGVVVHTRPGVRPADAAGIAPVTAVENQTYYFGNGNRTEVIRVNKDTPQADGLLIDLGSDGKVKSIQVPGSNRREAVPPGQAEYDKATGELLIKTPGGDFVYTSKGEKFSLGPAPSGSTVRPRTRVPLRAPAR